MSTSADAEMLAAMAAKAGGPLYEDSYCKIHEDHLEIVWFYFPTAGSKNIPFDAIKAVYYRKQNWRADFGLVKGWGQSFSACWWASDVKRGCRCNSTEPFYYNIVIDCGERTYKGFSCNNLDAFLAVLGKKVVEGTPIVNELPFRRCCADKGEPLPEGPDDEGEQGSSGEEKARG